MKPFTMVHLENWVRKPTDLIKDWASLRITHNLGQNKGCTVVMVTLHEHLYVSSVCIRPVSLTLCEDGEQWVLETLFGLLHLLLMLGLLVHQTPHMTVGWLDHGVELVGSAPVHLTPFYPCEQYCYGLTELAVICEKSERSLFDYLWHEFRGR